MQWTTHKTKRLLRTSSFTFFQTLHLILAFLMDSSKDYFKIAKLSDDNYHVCKSCIQLVLSLKELDEYLEDDLRAEDSDAYRTWRRGDNKAKAVIGLTLSGTHLEQVQHAQSAKEMWKLITEIFEKHSLLNKLAARHRLYTDTMNDKEIVLEFAHATGNSQGL